MIKNIVLSGGFYHGFVEFGAFCQLAQQNYFSMDNIETIYGTSAGGMIAAMMALKLPFEDVIDYAINRPWHKIISINLVGAFQAKGFISRAFFEGIFDNVLRACGLDISTTMQELYSYSNIELHLFSIELSGFDLVDISYKTFPDLLLVDAVHMTSAVPYVVEPCLHEGKYYIDGGLICNYPIVPCLHRGCMPDETLGIKLAREVQPISSGSNIFEYAYHLHAVMGYQIERVTLNDVDEDLMSLRADIHELVIEIGSTSVDDGYKALTTKKSRETLVNKGKEYANDFISKMNV
jgi:predicted acylesterase/phospholipase RssA